MAEVAMVQSAEPRRVGMSQTEVQHMVLFEYKKEQKTTFNDSVFCSIIFFVTHNA